MKLKKSTVQLGAGIVVVTALLGTGAWTAAAESAPTTPGGPRDAAIAKAVAKFEKCMTKNGVPVSLEVEGGSIAETPLDLPETAATGTAGEEKVFKAYDKAADKCDKLLDEAFGPAVELDPKTAAKFDKCLAANGVPSPMFADDVSDKETGPTSQAEEEADFKAFEKAADKCDAIIDKALGSSEVGLTTAQQQSQFAAEDRKIQACLDKKGVDIKIADGQEFAVENEADMKAVDACFQAVLGDALSIEEPETAKS